MEIWWEDIALLIALIGCVWGFWILMLGKTGEGKVAGLLVMLISGAVWIFTAFASAVDVMYQAHVSKQTTDGFKDIQKQLEELNTKPQK